MGKRSVKEDKTIYQETREECGLSRAAAAELLECISESRIEKIELSGSLPHPDEVLVMAKKYKKPSLCNYYCSRECPIGQEYVPAVEVTDLPTVTLEILRLLGRLDAEKERLIEISVDGTISEDERADFEKIKDELDKMSLAVDSLKAWFDERIGE
ncbi:MAG: helix-turn-helix domain-containing protein [Clostridia bacterium]|nr:helix-turn-helix domain-containing protein [Clostridia bacterium]MBQ1895965.1 helix-turn-helix domain-containing protein [Clostridia bacterium]MBQ2092135.1 helix-turn-helix domain-containing protein [Clostridia bacterium]MBQ2500333.1 helix-turn-helix domain-containing protein [Clostridia bacterium]MCR4747711.1 helix-turn-helix domain-containing protein [Clostridiales bacterium]